ncbi:MAG: N-acetylmuramoyl-L-alanine amidase [Nanoarchaeota archaeon]
MASSLPSRLLKSKKGDVELMTYYLIWTIVLVVIWVALLQYAARIASDTRFDRMKSAIDLSLTATAATIPGSSYMMTLPYSAFRQRLENGQAIAASNEKPKEPGIGAETIVEEKATYAIDTRLPFTAKEIPINSPILIIKDDNFITVRDKQDPTNPAQGLVLLNRLRCPSNPDISSLQVIIDPGHGGVAGAGDTGAQAETTIGKTIESEITTKIALSAAANMKGSGSTAALTRPDNTALEMKARLERVSQNAALVSVHAHKSKIPGQASITAYIKNDEKTRTESEKLACTLISAILEYKKSGEAVFIGGNIVSIDTTLDNTLEEDQMLDRPAVGVKLELNGIDLPSEKNPITGHEQEIGRQIANAMTGK